LNQIPQPVFLVKDGIVIYANHDARIRDVQLNTNIYELISIGLPEYRQYSSGKLMLTVSVAGILYNTVVTCSGDYHLFCLESEYSGPELRALALAAQTLREPLTNAELQINKLLPDPSIQASATAMAQIKAINQNLFQMYRAVRNMSDAATIANAAPTEGRNVTNAIAELIKKVNTQLEHKGNHIDFSPLNQPCYCLVNWENLERAILNLISNAVKYASDDGNIVLSMRISTSKLYISVESTTNNSACVISSKLFSGFTREPAIDVGNKGIGLGLTIVHGVATAHKGTLLVDQPKENRLRFTMSISMQTPKNNVVNSPRLQIDRTGGIDQVLVELADILSPDLYE
jgi:two-component sensor histidine kinase